jgi:hypothetical protein
MMATICFLSTFAVIVEPASRLPDTAIEKH